MEDEYLDLARKASRGDAPAVESLLERFLPQLKVFVRLRSGGAFQPKESVSDLVQSVCRDVLEHQERFQWHGEEAFRQWLFTAARRKIADRFEYYGAAKRDRNREATGGRSGVEDSLDALTASPGDTPTPSQHAMASEKLDQMEAALRQLPDQYQDVILLMRVLGLSTRDAAEQLGRTEGATQTLLSRALARLSDVLEDDGSPAD